MNRPIITENLDSSLCNDKCDYVEINECKDLNPNNYNLIVVQLNIRSLLSKQVELRKLLNDLELKNSKVDIVLLCETFLINRTKSLANVPGYTMYSDQRKQHKVVGTSILIRNGIVSRRHKDLLPFIERELEYTFIEIQTKNCNQVIVGSLYRPPNMTESRFVEDINELNHRVKNEGKELIFGMDHNMDLLKSGEHNLTQKFIDCLLDHDILPTITRLTRITRNTATLIDNIFVTNKLYRDFESALILSNISDHLPVLTLLKQTKFTDKKPLEFKCRSLKDANVALIRSKLYAVDWIGILKESTCERNFELFCNRVSEV